MLYFFLVLLAPISWVQTHTHKKRQSSSSSFTVTVTAWSICCLFFFFYPSNWCFQTCHRSVVAAQSHQHYFRCIHQGFQGLCLVFACWLRRLLVFYCLHTLIAGSRGQKMWGQSIRKRDTLQHSSVRHYEMKSARAEQLLVCSMSDMLQISTCRSPVSPHPSLIATLEINGGLVHERSDPAVLITLVFLPFKANRPWENALWPDYLILTATHAPVLFMDMPNLTFTMVIQGEHLRWRHGRHSEGSCLLLCLRPGKWAQVINKMVSFSASDAKLWLPAWVAQPKNGSFIPEEVPGVCSNLTSSFSSPSAK